MKKLFLSLIFACLLTTPTLALCFEADYEVMPGKGAYNEPFLVWVRTDPNIDDNQMWIYVFWDDTPIVSRTTSIVLGDGEYEHRWDLTLSPPSSYASEGDHDIEIWLETEAGEIKKLKYQYEVTDGLPPFDVWEQFLENHPEVLTLITGPKGDDGESIQGPPGESPEIDYDLLWDAVPDDMIDQLKGERGPQGPPGESVQGEPGKDASYTLVVALSVVGTLVSAGVSGFLYRRVWKKLNTL